MVYKQKLYKYAGIHKMSASVMKQALPGRGRRGEGTQFSFPFSGNKGWPILAQEVAHPAASQTSCIGAPERRALEGAMPLVE